MIIPHGVIETFGAAADTFCRLFRNCRKAVFLGRSLTTGL